MKPEDSSNQTPHSVDKSGKRTLCPNESSCNESLPKAKKQLLNDDVQLNDDAKEQKSEDKDEQGGDGEPTSKDYYFDSYSHYGIHEEMIKDKVRTETYRAAILDNRHLFKDKVVLDVGCGTGILSMFCAQAGAKHVYGIDCSGIIDQARSIVKRNGFEKQITLIKGKAEEVELPFPENPKDQRQVDIIVSEWMGYFLLYESMLDTVIFARDKWLVPDGVILPDKAVMYLCAVEDAHYKADRVDWWNEVYGFDFSPIRNLALKEPIVDVVNGNAVVTDTVPFLNVDILTCKKEDLAFESDFNLTAMRDDYLHGFVAYFECAFTQLHKPIGFSTSPFSNYTHWKQTLFYLPDALTVRQGEKVSGRITCKPNEKNNRDLDITLKVNFSGEFSKYSGEIDYHLR
jgi:protein arginine N-methyltransferase 1